MHERWSVGSKGWDGFAIALVVDAHSAQAWDAAVTRWG